MSYAKEVEMIGRARELGLLTTPYCFNVDDARLMAAAGADIVVAHMGLTTSGSIGAGTAFTLDESVTLVQAIADAAREVNPDVLVLSHGGPIAMPEDAQYVPTAHSVPALCTAVVHSSHRRVCTACGAGTCRTA
jgi:predicted TIM-barrel enzyme